MTPLTRLLLIVNAFVFVATLVRPDLEYMLSLYNYQSDEFLPFQIITNSFTHNGFFHLLWNMLPLLFFGPMLEDFLGQKRFGNFVMVSLLGLGISLFLAQSMSFENGMISWGKDHDSMIRGFSGMTAAIITLTAMYFPNNEIRIYFILPVKLKYLALIYFAFQIYMFYNKPYGDHTSYLAHILGVVFAVGIYKAWEIIDSRG